MWAILFFLARQRTITGRDMTVEQACCLEQAHLMALAEDGFELRENAVAANSGWQTMRESEGQLGFEADVAGQPGDGASMALSYRD